MRSPVLIGIGNELNGDDGVGPIVADKLADSTKFTVFNAGTQPDNFTGKITLMEPSHVVMVDAAMIEGEGGSIDAVPLQTVDDVCFHTHYLPLRHIVQRLIDKCSCKVLVIGIKPVSMEPGDSLSPPVKEAADKLVKMIKELDSG
jgi:hydrogenase 3 maturation protease